MDSAMILNTVRGMVKDFGVPNPAIDMEDDPNGTFGKVALVRDGYRLERLVGPTDIRRKHHFNSVVSFGEWLRRHANPESTEILFNDTDNANTMAATLDPFDQNSSFVTCALAEHPRVEEWNAMFDRCMDQRELWKFVRSHLADFTEAVDNDGDSLGSYGIILARTLQNLVVKKSGSFQQTINNAGNTVVVAKDDKTEFPSELPASFFINIPLLRDITVQDAVTGEEIESTHRLEVFLEIDTDDGIEIKLSCPDLAVAMFVERERAMDCLGRVLAKPDQPGFLVGRGYLQLMSVQRLKEVDTE